MKMAIIHDDLMRRGGAERVALTMVRAFPQADFFTLCYKPELTYDAFRSYKVHTSFFQKVAFSEASMKLLFYPLGIWAMKSLDLSKYDIVLISTTFCAKYIRLKPQTVLVTYCHTPFRLAWYPETYNKITKYRLLKWLMFQIICPRLRAVDKKYALRTNYFIANSEVTVQRIKECYTDKKPISLLPPPVDLRLFKTQKATADYYLLVSRFQPYKKIDLVIETFNELPQKKLIIVGTGVLENDLKKMANSNIVFQGAVSSEELSALYANCKALLFPQIEDFGITPLEANASGRPVIAFKAGGVLETMIPYEGKGKPFTALFFEQQNMASLTNAIENFEQIEQETDSDFICNNAKRFSEDSFIEKINGKIDEICKSLHESQQ